MWMPSNVRDQRRRTVGAPLADRTSGDPLAPCASGVTTSAERCIALLGVLSGSHAGDPQFLPPLFRVP